MTNKTRLLGAAALAALTVDPRLAASAPRVIRADAEDEDDKKEEPKADAQLKDFIADMRGCMDSVADSIKGLHARVDSMEEERKADAARRDSERKDAEEGDKKEDLKADARRKDAEGGDEGEPGDKPKEVAADKRKDGEDEDDKEKKADARRKDAEDEDEEDKKADARADAEIKGLREELKALKSRIGEVAEHVHRPRPDEEAAALADAQAAADEVFTALGERAPAPFATETADAYQRRMAVKLKVMSPRFKDANIYAVADSVAFQHTLEGIYSDAMAAARSPAFVPEGRLLPLDKSRGDGHRVTEYAGSSRTWMLPMSGVAQGVEAIHDQ